MSSDPVSPPWTSDAMTRRRLLQQLGAGGVAIAVPAALAGCGGGGGRSASAGSPASGAVRRGGTLTIGRNEEPLSFDPLVVSDNGTIWTILNIYDQLTRVNVAGDGVDPALAESWETSSDGKRYRFVLRQGVEFSDGSPMTADDVVFSLRRAIDPKQNGYAFLFNPVSRIRKDGAGAIEIALEEPFAPLVEHLAIFTASVLPKRLLERDAKQLARQPVGTGPFKLGRFDKGRLTRLDRNERYWQDGKPFLDRVDFLYVPDDNTRLLKLQGGEIHVALNVPYNQLEPLGRRDDMRVMVEPLFRLDAIWLNHKHKPLGDADVRRALSHATDREAINRAALFGAAQVANDMKAKMKFWREDVPVDAFDLEKAKQLLDSSAAAGGFTLPLMISSGDSVQKQIAAIVQESWGKIGVRVEIDALDIGTSTTRFFKEDYAAFLNYITSDVTAPDELAGLEFDVKGGTDSFFTGYDNPEAARLVHQAAAARSDAARAPLFGRLQELVMGDAPLVALTFSPSRSGVGQHVKGFRTLQTGTWRLEDVSLSA